PRLLVLPAVIGGGDHAVHETRRDVTHTHELILALEAHDRRDVPVRVLAIAGRPVENRLEDELPFLLPHLPDLVGKLRIHRFAAFCASALLPHELREILTVTVLE